MEKILFACLVWLVCFSNFANADNYLTCNTCTTAFSMQQKAMQKVRAMTEGSGINSSHKVHIANFTKGFAKSFSVTSRPEFGQWGELETVVVARVSNTPQHIQESVNVGYTMLSRSAFGKPIQVPVSSGFDSAWDLARNYSNHERFDNWFESNHSFIYWASQFASAIGGNWLGGVNGMEIKFTFDNGSSIVMKAATLGATLRLTYKEKSARDANGNMIPDTGETVGGNYSFTTDQGLQDFINTLAQHGIQVTVIHGSGWMGGGRGGTVTIVPFSPR
ncbi:hypothetical protein [Pseudoalteromonas byunsanensis]|uniref:Uncharacterized protein n=1 Tax=Pseudoalteromonas byunsanensis TaxID=327939 RepID=A0A1S1N8N6_9GAMM|nr:hypothetical protein [Pseudoalteromonas byunsanensis]OHU96379.1 hypothetical protein BIW53_07510 [Pseudoalteromonas byunsanensis]